MSKLGQEQGISGQEAIKKFREDKENHLKKFEGDNFFMLINKHLDHYYQRYQEEGGKLTKDQFRRQVFIPDIKENYYLSRINRNTISEEMRDKILIRGIYLEEYYREILFEGEIAPDDIGRDLNERRTDYNFHKEAETFWAVSASQYNLAQTLEVN